MSWLVNKILHNTKAKTAVSFILVFCLCCVLFYFFSPASIVRGGVLVSGPKAKGERSLKIAPVQGAVKTRQDHGGLKKRYKIELGEDEVEIGGAGAGDFKPQARLKRWGDEAYLDIKVSESGIPAREKSVELKNDRIGWQSANMGVGFYKQPAKQAIARGRGEKQHSFVVNEKGGLEFELILYERPRANIISLPIESKGLKFHYQPPLTEAEKSQGIVRPDEAVGSYAVYHDSKKDGKYKTGKAFHIYRPKIIDDKGNWVWGQLNIDTVSGILKITIDQSWLNNASYPVTIDPEFGYTDIGSSAIPLNNVIRGSVFTALEFIPASITAYLENADTGSSHHAKYAIYKANDTKLLGETQEVTVPAGAKGWYEGLYTTSFNLYEQQYALSANSDSDNILIYFDTGSAGQGFYMSNDYTNEWPQTTEGFSYDNRLYSIYDAESASITITVNLDTTPPDEGEGIPCGESLSITHTAGSVAPVTKTVTYGTVLTSLTGTEQCWITQNLGADQQATSATDSTEASAGWYWQFNKPQGYKYDTARTPSTTWITSIDENSDWTTANDPCTLLLGSDWRIPTLTEWTNADANGGWTDYTTAYNSVLKLHTAGYLHWSAGALYSRGAIGYYWSMTKSISSNGYCLYSSSSASAMQEASKAHGFSVRCLSDSAAPNAVSASSIFTADTTVKGGADVSINSTGHSDYNVWFAPLGTTSFTAGSTMTTAIGTATSILAPADEGVYRLYILDAVGNVSNPSTAVLTVDNTAPANTSIFTTDTTVKGGADVSINSTGHSDYNVWFAPSGTTLFTAGSTMTTAIGTATSILAPAGDGTYKLYILDAAGNVSSPSTATLTVDNTAPDEESCGSNFTATHTAGSIAPVDKTVTYGTVLTDLTGTAKCWITQNLGADQQATSATDSTEASAGWYWQFNKPQGYKHDGTTRTPSTTWITSIDENSDWTTANDPCTLLLGSDWRIPTLTEWTNADANGGWTDYTTAYNSVLKLHTAGTLNYSSGNLEYRGSYGRYWLSMQYNSNTSYWLRFYSGACGMENSIYKSYGETLRCLSDSSTPNAVSASSIFTTDTTVKGGADVSINSTGHSDY
ncbi:MAG: hypothetical protein PHV77_04820, partial [Candidatus Omnitrophica bacterium]|nr:hypothetical protein [Candidatus Omnitrophota bacterium]